VHCYAKTREVVDGDDSTAGIVEGASGDNNDARPKPAVERCLSTPFAGPTPALTSALLAKC